MKRIEKPWGEEQWVVHNEHYALKIIKVKAGHRTSLQYHNVKHETNYIDSGSVKATVESNNGELEVRVFGPGSVIDVSPGRKHRIEALEDTRMIEVSTPQLDDLVRVEDDYRR